MRSVSTGPAPRTPKDLRQKSQGILSRLRKPLSIFGVTPSPVSGPSPTFAVPQQQTSNSLIQKAKTQQKNEASALIASSVNLSTRSDISKAPKVNHTREGQYSRSYPLRVLSKQLDLSKTLAPTQISPAFRTKMVDWFIEVFNSFSEKCSNSTFFRAVLIMDLFLKHQKEKMLVDSNLHLIGITSVFIASKYEDMYHITIQEVYDKIAFGKFSKEEVKECEAKILLALGFKISYPSLLDVLETILETFCAKNQISRPERNSVLEKSTYVLKLMTHFERFNDNLFEIFVISALFFTLKYVKLTPISIEAGASIETEKIQRPIEPLSNFEKDLLSSIETEYFKVRLEYWKIAADLHDNWDLMHRSLPKVALPRHNSKLFLSLINKS